VGVRVEPALPACMAGAMGGVAAFVECLVVGMAQRNASTASFQGRTLFSPFGFGDVHDRPRQATACEVGSTSLPLPSTCMHGRVRLLGRSNPPPVPHKPTLSTPPRQTSPKLFSLIIPPPPHPLDCAPLQSLRPHLQSDRQTLLSHVLSPLPTGLPSQPVVSCRRFCFCCWVRANCRSPDRSLPETSAHLQARLRHLARPSSLLPALAISHPPPNSHRRLLRYRLAGIHLLCSTRPVASAPLILLSTRVLQANPSPVPAPLRF
jgi:hypothetical protein